MGFPSPHEMLSYTGCRDETIHDKYCSMARSIGLARLHCQQVLQAISFQWSREKRDL